MGVDGVLDFTTAEAGDDFPDHVKGSLIESRVNDERAVRPRRNDEVVPHAPRIGEPVESVGQFESLELELSGDGTLRSQKANDGLVAVFVSHVQGTSLVFRDRVDVGSILDEKLDDFEREVTAAGKVEQRHMEVIHLIDIGPFGDQVFDDLGPPLHDRAEENRLAVLIRDVDDFWIPLDDLADFVQVAGLDRIIELLGGGCGSQ